MKHLTLAVLALLVPWCASAVNHETVPPNCTVSELSSGICAPARLGTRVVVNNSDAANDTNCASGTGAITTTCEYNGTTWLSTTLTNTPLTSPLVFCGQGANNNTNFLGPATSLGTELVPGNAACDGLDSTTEATADAIPNGVVNAHTVMGMICQMTDTGVNNTVTFQLRATTADVTGMSCTVTLDGSGTESCRTAVGTAPVAIPAASVMDVEQTRSGTDDLSASDALCTVFTVY